MGLIPAIASKVLPEVPLTHFPLPGEGQTSEELLTYAQRNMRCIDFADIEPMLLVRSANHASRRVGRFLEGLARPLKQGESVDFFMSHSWYVGSLG